MFKALQRCVLAALAIGMLTSTIAFAQTTVTMWSFLDPAKSSPRERALKQIIDGFEAKHPSIKIKVEPQIWHQIAPKFVMAAATGAAPDIAWINYPRLVLPFAANAAADLGPLFLDKWDAAEKADFITQAPFEAVTRDRKVLAAPIFLLSNILMYRKDLFAESGVTTEDVRTWDGLMAAASKLTADKDRDGQTDVYGFGLALSKDGASTNPVMVALLESQPKIFDDECRPILATPAGIRALELQADFVRNKVTSAEASARTSDDNQDLFIGGRQAIVVGGSSRVVGNREKAAWGAQNMGVLQWPSWDGKRSGPYAMDGWFAVISSKSPRAKEAAMFVEYMIGRETAPLWTLSGGQVPFRKSVLDMPELATADNAWMREIARGWSENVAFLPPQCNFGAVMGDLNVATQKVIRGDLNAKDALAEVERLGGERR